jgi:uncharacterized protein (DUF427 family)
MARQRIEPGPGQESVWDYPRPPRLERRIKVVFGGVALACTTRAWRVLETSHPPVYYVPPEDIKTEHLRPSDGASFCEWKGWARNYDVVTDERSETRAPIRRTGISKITWRSTLRRWTPAGWTARRPRRRRG